MLYRMKRMNNLVEAELHADGGGKDDGGIANPAGVVAGAPHEPVELRDQAHQFPFRVIVGLIWNG